MYPEIQSQLGPHTMPGNQLYLEELLEYLYGGYVVISS